MKNLDEITFSQEELIYLLRSLNLPDLPGMGDHPWGHIPEENALLVMETVGRGLVARRIAQFGTAQMEIDADIARLLSECAYPRQMTVLIYNQGETAIHRSFFRGAKYDVEHFLPSPWLHQFKVKPKSDMGLSLIQSLIKDAPNGETGNVISVQQSRLDEIRQLAADDIAGASQQLLELGLTSAFAEKLANVFGAPKIKILLQAVYDLGKNIQQNVFSILADEVSCWLVIAGQPGSSTIQVMQVNRKKLHEIILATFQPIANLPHKIGEPA